MRKSPGCYWIIAAILMGSLVLATGVDAAGEPASVAPQRVPPKTSATPSAKSAPGPEAYQSTLSADPAAAMQFSLDSAQRDIRRKILSDAEKKEIRACEREKSLALKQCRDSQPTRKGLEYKLNQAKLKGGDPNESGVQSTMEQLFGLEKACDDQYNATERAKQCFGGEKKRQAALEKALGADKSYQGLVKKSKSLHPDTAPAKPTDAL